MTKLIQQNATQMPLDGSCSPRILLINSDTMVCQQLQRLFSQCAYSVSVMQSGQDALEIIADGSTDLVLTDLHVPDLDGMKFVERIRRLHADVPVIVLTREKDIELAVKSLKLGVSDYISMPFSADAVRESTRSALEKAQVFTELRHMRRGFAESFEFVGMLSRTPEMYRVFETIRMVSNMDVTVLVEGETGTGKELVAKAIHDRSARREGKFVTINCAGVPDALLESELFGFERGAFTGADHSKEGMIELAHGGTLFLDEIESMSLSMQAKLLHVIEDRKVQRLGGNRKYDIDMRVIAATNVPAKELVAERKMRNDFYYRINVVSIQLLPLRQRRADIPLLVQNFLRKHPFAAQKGIMEISRQAMSQLMHHSWPGNFRELQNVLEKAVVLAVLPVIDKVDILDEPPPPGIDRASKSTGITFAQWIREQEKAYLVKQLEAFHGSIDRAAANSGICVRTLFRKMRLYGLDKKQFRSQAPEISLPPEVSSVIENKVSATNPHFRH